LFILAQQFLGQPVTPIILVGQPLLQAAFGSVGGFFGSVIWRSPPSLKMPAPARKSVPLRSSQEGLTLLAGPVAWGRVLTGIAVSVGGGVWANVILEVVLEAGEGSLAIASHLQANLVPWEICVLALLGGSALAGANTFNGVKQGLIVGLGASTVLLGLGIASGTMSLDLLLFSVTSALSLGL